MTDDNATLHFESAVVLLFFQTGIHNVVPGKFSLKFLCVVHSMIQQVHAVLGRLGFRTWQASK
jgi:hypothetical protein